jgi:sensor histidine kinase YesM
MENHLKIILADNGIGMDPKEAAKLINEENFRENHFSGIGLAHTHNRIKFHYGPGYGLCIATEKNHGCTIRILIPNKMLRERDQHD